MILVRGPLSYVYPWLKASPLGGAVCWSQCSDVNNCMWIDPSLTNSGHFPISVAKTAIITNNKKSTLKFLTQILNYGVQN